jgi:protein bicaudal C
VYNKEYIYNVVSEQSQTQVQMSLEISPVHHSVVVGRGAEQLKVIMKGTRTQIMVPDADDPNIPALRKSCVTITGHIADVYAARQQLVVSTLALLITECTLNLVSCGVRDKIKE